MPSLARKNLFHDKVRLTVTLTGIIFAVVLIVVQLGLFLGFAATTSNVIDHAGADVWITARGLRNFDQATPFSERTLYQALATDGVVSADKYVMQSNRWKRPDGGEESIAVIGFNLNTGLGGPWNLTAGNLDDLHSADTVIIDEIYLKKLGITELGQTAEIGGRRARVVGFSRGIRSFTTNPRVFTSYQHAIDYMQYQPDRTSYILVKAAAGVSPEELKGRLSARLDEVDIYTSKEFASKTQNYWMFTTGAGVAILISAGLGLLVGIVIVAQTIYSTTVDHIREYGTLKAMGASNGYLYRVIINQAVISAVIGYTFGIIISYLVVQLSQQTAAVIILPGALAAGMLALTLLMCIGASLVSISHVTRIDPALVFKG